jgi:hypothetical protein
MAAAGWHREQAEASGQGGRAGGRASGVGGCVATVRGWGADGRTGSVDEK